MDTTESLCPLCDQPTEIVIEGDFAWCTCKKRCIWKIHGYVGSKPRPWAFTGIKVWKSVFYTISLHD